MSGLPTTIATTTAAPHPELVGVDGVGLDFENIKLENVITILKDKILHPDKYLPVKDVFTRPSDDGIGTYREMSLGPNRIIENIYWVAEDMEVQFKVVGAETEHVNKIIVLGEGEEKKFRLEFYARNMKTLERVHWPAPKHIALGGVAKVLEEARSLP